jgi:transposase
VGGVTNEFILFFQDEMRYGLISNYRRSWSPIGVRTIIDTQQAFANRYLFSAIAPLTGESFHLIGLEENTSAMVALFFDELEKAYPDKQIVMVFDNAPSHRPKIVRARARMTCIYLPPYSPELNPVERFFGEMRKVTANRIFKTLEEQEALIEEAVKQYSLNEKKMKRLTGYGWIKEQIRMG